jgi:hypothetical protein
MKHLDSPLVAPTCHEAHFISLHRCPACGDLVEFKPAGHTHTDAGEHRRIVRAVCLRGHAVPEEDFTLPGSEDDVLDWMLEAVADMTLLVKPRFAGVVQLLHLHAPLGPH